MPACAVDSTPSQTVHYTAASEHIIQLLTFIFLDITKFDAATIFRAISPETMENEELWSRWTADDGFTSEELAQNQYAFPRPVHGE